MNDDLILRARLHEGGFLTDEIEKAYSLNPTKWGAGSAAGKLSDRLPGGDKRLAARLGQDKNFGANQRALDTANSQDEALAAYEQKRGQKGKETLSNVPSGMTDKTLTANVREATGEGPPGQRAVSPLSAMDKGMTTTGLPSQPDNSNTGDPNIPDKTTTTVENGPNGQPNQINTETTMNANAEAPAAGGGDINTETGGGAPDPNAGAAQQPAQQQPAQQQPAQQQPATGGGGINPNVQGMAQQFQAGQDMQAIQQGKGADKQSWLKNRSGMGKLMDIATFGATSRFGSTGGAARSKANQQSEQQTQNYQAATQRMNQRAMGMNPTMVATSLDSQLSAYSDIIAIRKGIQERNTTHNLRR